LKEAGRMNQYRNNDEERNSPPHENNRLRPTALSGKRRRKKICPFCKDKLDKAIDYKQADRLKRYLTDRGKIVPQRIAGTCAKHHRELSTVIRRARTMALMPYASAGERSEHRHRDRDRDGDREGGRDRGRGRDGGRERMGKELD